MITKDTQARRLKRVRAHLGVSRGIPRLTVFRTNRHLWIQIIDDLHGKTLVSATTKTLKNNQGNKTEQAKNLGLAMAKLAQTKKIVHIRFDRGLYRYHGRVKALAESLREGGLKF